MNRGELKALLQQAENIVPKVKGTQGWLSATIELFAVFFFFLAKLVWALAYQCGGFLGSILFFGQTKTCCDKISSEIRLRRRITLKIGIRILIKKRFESAFCLLIRTQRGCSPRKLLRTPGCSSSCAPMSGSVGKSVLCGSKPNPLDTDS